MKQKIRPNLYVSSLEHKPLPRPPSPSHGAQPTAVFKARLPPPSETAGIY